MKKYPFTIVVSLILLFSFACGKKRSSPSENNQSKSKSRGYDLIIKKRPQSILAELKELEGYFKKIGMFKENETFGCEDFFQFDKKSLKIDGLGVKYFAEKKLISFVKEEEKLKEKLIEGRNNLSKSLGEEKFDTEEILGHRIVSDLKKFLKTSVPDFLSKNETKISKKELSKILIKSLSLFESNTQRNAFFRILEILYPDDFKKYFGVYELDKKGYSVRENNLKEYAKRIEEFLVIVDEKIPEKLSSRKIKSECLKEKISEYKEFLFSSSCSSKQQFLIENILSYEFNLENKKEIQEVKRKFKDNKNLTCEEISNKLLKKSSEGENQKIYLKKNIYEKYNLFFSDYFFNEKSQWKEKDFKTLKQCLENIPKKVIEKMRKINPASVFVLPHVKVIEDTSSPEGITATWGDYRDFEKRIRIIKEGKQTDCYLLIHEIAHHLDNELNLENQWRKGLPYKTFFKKDAYKSHKSKPQKLDFYLNNDFPTNYSGFDITEDFAETFSFFILYPDRLKELSPQRFTLLESLF